MSRPGLLHRSHATAAAVAAPVATNRPTPQFRQHHTVETPRVDTSAFRQAWRVQSRLDGLLEAGRIDREQFEAAQVWRRWAEVIAPTKVQSWDVRVDASRLANDASMVIRVNAQAKLRSAIDALGPLRHRLLEMSVGDDRSWREIGDRLGVDAKTATGRVIEAIAALADWHAGRAVAPAPIIRFRNQPGSVR
jgi:DNA-directed RNA polymerase specialized sigma24 family protein